MNWEDKTYILHASMNKEKTVGCVYKLYSGYEIWYIGQTKQTLYERLRGHATPTRGPGSLGLALMKQITLVESAEVPLEDLDRIENEQIHKYHPKYNGMCRKGCNHYYSQHYDC